MSSEKENIYLFNLRELRCTLSEYIQAKPCNIIKYFLRIYSVSKNSNLIVNNEYTSKNIQAYFLILCMVKRGNDKYI